MCGLCLGTVNGRGEHMKYLLKISPNRVRRNYRGGAGIDWLYGQEDGLDGACPEEWVASLVEAKNPGMEELEGEGLASCVVDGKAVLLKTLIAKTPEFYFGKEYFEKKGADPGFLLKVLDSAMRLHVQAHPTAEFARKRLHAPYGKLECYYILHVRAGIEPYIRLGFQHPPSRTEWKRIIEEQDISAMDACFEKIPVEEGQVWFIPGGMPHAIGEGILMLEIMEPSDWAVRCEFEREGVMVPPDARFMGRGLEFCLDIFDYTPYSVREISKRSRIFPKAIETGANYRLEWLVDKHVTSCFEVKRLRMKGGGMNLTGGALKVGIVTKGSLVLRYGMEETRLKRGESVLIAAAAERIEVVAAEGEAELCLVGSAGAL